MVFVFDTTICITCNQPYIFVESTRKTATLQFTRWALFAVNWAAIIFSLDCPKFLYCWLWFPQTQTLLKHFQLDLQKCHDSLFKKNGLQCVSWTGSDYKSMGNLGNRSVFILVPRPNFTLPKSERKKSSPYPNICQPSYPIIMSHLLVQIISTFKLKSVHPRYQHKTGKND